MSSPKAPPPVTLRPLTEDEFAAWSERATASFAAGIEVDEDQRGKGYGRSIMLAGEEECRRRGFEHLELNVFGNNTTAIALYDSLGYVVTAQQMRKTL